MKISIIIGTRTGNQVSTIIRECERLGIDYFVLHCGRARWKMGFKLCLMGSMVVLSTEPNAS